MPNVSVRVDDERREELDELADSAGLSRAEYIRDALEVREDYHELQEKHKQLQSEHDELRENNESLQEEYAALQEKYSELQVDFDELQTETDRLRREKRQILDQRKENTELAKYVEEERSLSRQRAEAGIATRAKWWLFGMNE